jgi:hypothetical protein
MKPKGGARPGAGRKKTTHHGKPALIYLYPEHINFLHGVNGSDLIRQLLDVEMKQYAEERRVAELERIRNNTWRIGGL